MKQVITDAVEALRRGDTLMYPTDTIWGIGCDATVKEAVEKIYAVKMREAGRPLLVLANEGMLKADTPEVVKQMLRSERPTTVVMEARYLDTAVASNVPAEDGTVGVRVPRMEFCQQMLRELGHPIVSTSANLSGKPSPRCYDDIDPDLRERIDVCVPDNKEYHHQEQPPSRIVRVWPDGKTEIIRE